MQSARRILTFFCLAAVAVVVAGCRVNEAREVESYRVWLDLPPAAADAQAPLDLRQALLLANANDETLDLEGEQLVRALVQRRRTVAQFLPLVSLRGDLAFRDDTGGSSAVVGGGGGGGDGGGVDGGGVGGGGGGAFFSSRRTTFDLSTVGQIELFSGGRRIARVRRDDAEIRRRVGLLLDAREAVLLDVADVFLETAAAAARVAALADLSASQEDRVGQIDDRVRAGLARPLDTLQARTQLSATRARLIEARRADAAGIELLAFAIAAPVPTAGLRPEPPRTLLPPDDVGPVAAWEDVAETRRCDLRAAAEEVAAATFEAEAAWRQYYPTVTLDLTGFLSRQSNPEDLDWLGTLRASLPIFDGGRIRADVRETLSLARDAASRRARLRRDVTRAVRVAYLDLDASRQTLAESQERATLAEEALSQADRLFDAGRATNLERLQAIDDLIEARLAVIDERVAVSRAWLRLLRESGGLAQAVAADPRSGES